MECMLSRLESEKIFKIQNCNVSDTNLSNSNDKTMILNKKTHNFIKSNHIKDKYTKSKNGALKLLILFL